MDDVAVKTKPIRVGRPARDPAGRPRTYHMWGPLRREVPSHTIDPTADATARRGPDGRLARFGKLLRT